MSVRRLAFGVACAFLGYGGLVVPWMAHADAGVTAAVTVPPTMTAGVATEFSVKITNGTGVAAPAAQLKLVFGVNYEVSLPASVDHFDAATNSWQSQAIPNTRGQIGYGTDQYTVALPTGTTTERFRITPMLLTPGEAITISAASWVTTMPMGQMAGGSAWIVAAPTPSAQAVVAMDTQHFTLTPGAAPQQIVASFVNSTSSALASVKPGVAFEFIHPNPPGNGTQVDFPAGNLLVSWLNGQNWQPVAVGSNAADQTFRLIALFPTSFALEAGERHNVTFRIALAKTTPPGALNGILSVQASQFSPGVGSFTVADPTAAPTPSNSTTLATTPPSLTPASSTSADATPTDSGSLTDSSSPSSSAAAGASTANAGANGSSNQLAIIMGAIAALGLSGASLAVWWKKFR